MTREQAHGGDNGASTEARLVTALLGYFLLVTLVVTLSPFDFAARPVRISWLIKTSDVVGNVALFVPLGFLLRSLELGSGRCGRAVAVAALFSVLIETAQIFLRGRYVSPIDVATNSCGAYVGAWARHQLERLAVWQPHLVSRVGLDLPLVGLLYLLVPQLWLNGIALVDDARRSVTTLLLGAAGAIVFVALHRYRWQGSLRLAAHVVPPIAFLWFAVGALPALAAAPLLFAAVGIAISLVTWWLVRPAPPFTQRRFEVDTLRRFLPVFTAYLVIAALWPPFRPAAPWHGAIGFVDRLNNAAVINLLLLLEQVGAFTLLGYAVAEWRSRQELTLAADLRRVFATAVALAGTLEIVQGFAAGPGASVLRALLSTMGAGYGAAVYHLARAHVRALRHEGEARAADAA